MRLATGRTLGEAAVWRCWRLYPWRAALCLAVAGLSLFCGTVSAQATRVNPPAILTFTPADGATEVAVDTSLVMVFDMQVAKTGTLAITIFDPATSTTVPVRTITANDVTVDGAVATAVITVPLAHSASYYVNISGISFRQGVGNYYPGIGDATTWNFTTAAPPATNQAPTAITLTPATVAEGQPAGTTVGSFSTTDDGFGGTTYTYALVDTDTYPDNAQFTLADGALKTAAVFTYATKSNYLLRVQSTDIGGLSLTKTIGVSVTTSVVNALTDALGGLAPAAYGQWQNIPAAATTADISGLEKSAVGPAILRDGSILYAAWAQKVGSSGKQEIYLRWFDTAGQATTWQELDGSATGGGISNTTDVDSVVPRLFMQTNLTHKRLWVVWQEGQASEIVQQIQAFVASLAGASSFAAVTEALQGFLVELSAQSSESHVFAKVYDFDPGIPQPGWAELQGSATGLGVSNNDAASLATSPDIGGDSDGYPFIVWDYIRFAPSPAAETRLEKITSLWSDTTNRLGAVYGAGNRGSGWKTLAGGDVLYADNAGISNKGKWDLSIKPRLRMLGGQPVMAWLHTEVDAEAEATAYRGCAQVHLLKYDGSNWAALGDSDGDGGVSQGLNTICSQQALAPVGAGSTAGSLALVWTRSGPEISGTTSLPVNEITGKVYDTATRAGWTTYYSQDGDHNGWVDLSLSFTDLATGADVIADVDGNPVVAWTDAWINVFALKWDMTAKTWNTLGRSWWFPSAVNGDYGLQGGVSLATVPSGQPAIAWHGAVLPPELQTALQSIDSTDDITPEMVTQIKNAAASATYDIKARCFERATLVAVNDSYATEANTDLTVAAETGVMANDTSLPDSGVRAVKVAGPAHGTVTLNDDGSFTYSPALNYVGADAFTYQLEAGSDTSTTAAVAITVSNPDGELTVTTPAGGEVWVPGNPQALTWTATGNFGANVKLELYRGLDLVTVITNSTALNPGSYQWTVPLDAAPDSSYRIRVTALDFPTVFGISNAFSISNGSSGTEYGLQVDSLGYTDGTGRAVSADFSTEAQVLPGAILLTSVTRPEGETDTAYSLQLGAHNTPFYMYVDNNAGRLNLALPQVESDTVVHEAVLDTVVAPALVTTANTRWSWTARFRGFSNVSTAGTNYVFGVGLRSADGAGTQPRFTVAWYSGPIPTYSYTTRTVSNALFLCEELVNTGVYNKDNVSPIRENLDPDTAVVDVRLQVSTDDRVAFSYRVNSDLENAWSTPYSWSVSSYGPISGMPALQPYVVMNTVRDTHTAPTATTDPLNGLPLFSYQRTFTFNWSKTMRDAYDITLSGFDPSYSYTTQWSQDRRTFSLTFNQDLPVGTTVSVTANGYGGTYKFRDIAGNPPGGPVAAGGPVSSQTQNLAPTDFFLSPAYVEENRNAGTAVGTFWCADDRYGGSAFSYALVDSGNYPDNASFAIDGDVLRTAAVLNRAGQGRYTLRVQVTDAGGITFAKDVVVLVTVAEGISLADHVEFATTNYGNSRGSWQNIPASAPAADISGQEGSSISPALVRSGNVLYAAWAQKVGTAYEVYVRQCDTGATSPAWTELGGSASGGGVSNTPDTDSMAPRLFLQTGVTPNRLWVVWQEGQSDSVVREIQDYVATLATAPSGAAATAAVINYVATKNLQPAYIHARYYEIGGSTTEWQQLAGSATGSGVSQNDAYSLAMHPDITAGTTGATIQIVWDYMRISPEGGSGDTAAARIASAPANRLGGIYGAVNKTDGMGWLRATGGAQDYAATGIDGSGRWDLNLLPRVVDFSGRPLVSWLHNEIDADSTSYRATAQVHAVRLDDTMTAWVAFDGSNGDGGVSRLPGSQCSQLTAGCAIGFLALFWTRTGPEVSRPTGLLASQISGKAYRYDSGLSAYSWTDYYQNSTNPGWRDFSRSHFDAAANPACVVSAGASSVTVAWTDANLNVSVSNWQVSSGGNIVRWRTYGASTGFPSAINQEHGLQGGVAVASYPESMAGFDYPYVLWQGGALPEELQARVADLDETGDITAGLLGDIGVAMGAGTFDIRARRFVYGVSESLLAVPDTFVVFQNTQFSTTGLIQNDLYPASSSKGYYLQVPPAHGTVYLPSMDYYSGYFTYTPAGDFLGEDYFSYYFAVSGQPSNSAWVRLLVKPYPALDLTCPAGHEAWPVGATQAVRWTSDGAVGNEILIELFKGGQKVSSLAEAAPNTGSFVWTPASSLVAGTDYTVKISSVATPSLNDTSGTFEITEASPGAPFGLDLLAEDDTGVSNSDNITRLTQNLRLRGTADAETTVTIWEGTAELVSGTAAAFATGLTIPQLNPGSHTLTATAKFVEGPASAAADALLVTVDTTGPQPQQDSPFDPPWDGDGVPTGIHPAVTLDEAVYAYTGQDATTVTLLKRGSSEPAFPTGFPISMNDPRLQISGATLSLTPSTTELLATQTQYYVEIGPKCLTDAAGNFYAGVEGRDNWFFTTADNPGVWITSFNGGVVTSEAGSTAIFWTYLAAPPAPSTVVTVQVQTSDSLEARVVFPTNGLCLFTNQNWNVPMRVLVQGVDDQLVDSTVPYTVKAVVTASTDSGYTGLQSDEAQAYNLDNEPSGALFRIGFSAPSLPLFPMVPDVTIGIRDGAENGFAWGEDYGAPNETQLGEVGIRLLNGTSSLQVDIRNAGLESTEWLLQVDTLAGLELLMEWAPGQVPAAWQLTMQEVAVQEPHDPLPDAPVIDLGSQSSLSVPAALQAATHLWKITARELQSFDLKLHPGWNLVSVPLEPGYRAVAQVFAAVLGTVIPGTNCLLEYDAGSKLYRPAAEVVALRGYWVYATASATVTIYGLPPGGTAALKTGWNLYGPATAISVASLAAYTNGFAIWGWHRNHYETGQANLEPGNAYWIHSSADQDSVPLATFAFSVAPEPDWAPDEQELTAMALEAQSAFNEVAGDEEALADVDSHLGSRGGRGASRTGLPGRTANWNIQEQRLELNYDACAPTASGDIFITREGSLPDRYYLVDFQDNFRFHGLAVKGQIELERKGLAPLTFALRILHNDHRELTVARDRSDRHFKARLLLVATVVVRSDAYEVEIRRDDTRSRITGDPAWGSGLVHLGSRSLVLFTTETSGGILTLPRGDSANPLRPTNGPLYVAGRFLNVIMEYRDTTDSISGRLDIFGGGSVVVNAFKSFVRRFPWDFNAKLLYQFPVTNGRPALTVSGLPALHVPVLKSENSCSQSVPDDIMSRVDEILQGISSLDNDRRGQLYECVRIFLNGKDDSKGCLVPSTSEVQARVKSQLESRFDWSLIWGD